MKRLPLLLVGTAILLAFAGACEQDKRPEPTAVRTLPPGVRTVTPTEEPPTVVPATPRPEAGIIGSDQFDAAGTDVTLPLTPATFVRIVETCASETCFGFSLPPGTPILAPFDGKIVIGPSLENTTCSQVVAIYRGADANSGRAIYPPETVDLVLGCDSVIEVEKGAAVKRGDRLATLGQRGIYEGQGDAPPTVLRMTCSYTAKPCAWAGGKPNFFVVGPELTPTGTVTGTPTATATVTASATP